PRGSTVKAPKYSYSQRAQANGGGIDGLTKNMDAGKVPMSANPQLAKSLTADDMTMVSKGFGNEVAKAGGIPMPNTGVDLKQVLEQKHLSQDDLKAMGNALQAAAKGTLLSPDG